MSRLRLHQDTSRLLNRGAIVILPGEPFMKWLHGVDPISSDYGLADLRVEPRVYLVPDSGSAEEIERLLRRNFDTIFKAELDGWFRDESTWPKKRTYGMFREWFEYSYHSVLVDLAKDDLCHD